jgi:hypothetical protein
MSKLVLIPNWAAITAASVAVAVELSEPYNVTKSGRCETTERVCRVLGAVDFIERNGIVEAIWPHNWFSDIALTKRQLDQKLKSNIN